MTKKRQFCPRGHDAFQAGRDASKRCLQCNAEDAAAKAALAEQAVAEEHAALERRREEIDRRLEQEYQAAIKRGGYDAAMARWDKAYGETNDAYGGRYGLCQWEDEVDGEFIGRMCYRRTTGVYCHMHDRQLERESERKRKAKERETAPPADPKPRPSRRREGSSARPRGRRCITNGMPGVGGAERLELREAQHLRLGRVQDQASGSSSVLCLVDLALHA